MLKKGARMRGRSVACATGPCPGHRAPEFPGSRPEHERRQLYFGEFSAELDASDCRGLYRGHEPIGLSDVPRKVLFLLLQERPRPVLAKALMNALWHPGANPSNVAKQVKALRIAMGDERSQEYIRTVKKEGYAFVMPVTEAPMATNVVAAAGRREAHTRTRLDSACERQRGRRGSRLAEQDGVAAGHDEDVRRLPGFVPSRPGAAGRGDRGVSQPGSAAREPQASAPAQLVRPGPGVRSTARYRPRTRRGAERTRRGDCVERGAARRLLKDLADRGQRRRVLSGVHRGPAESPPALRARRPQRLREPERPPAGPRPPPRR